ncbi:roadblock/LC7 domain-containing protein [Streptacidiphilus albus]|jgi:predicted regulator of Ras-like GTPase activity (Roadblock/LC7/MglB family)|uniref:roadblock/LC7 domain-containing protein n=1 Tax=Streptacidiphilus albus TaxID=105425 RepID=UPI0005A7281E|nr:roadblock/LC7 domain-containing protein [Streptacidiphilus albus]
MTLPVVPETTINLGWLLNDMVRRVPEIGHAVVLSTDGLLLGASSELNRDQAEQLSAVASGFHSLAKGAGRHFGGGAVRQTMVEMEVGFLFVCAAGDNACLTVLTPEGADIGVVAYEMAMLVKRVGQHLSVDSRLRRNSDAGW